MPLLTEDLGYTKLDFATIIFVFSLFYAGGQFVNALLSDRFGARLVVGIGMIVSAASNIAMGFAGSLMAFTLLAPLNGLGQSTGWSGLVKTMASWFRPRERGVVMGWWGTSFVLGGSFATIFATFLVTSETLLPGVGWRRGFFFPLSCSVRSPLCSCSSCGIDPPMSVSTLWRLRPAGAKLRARRRQFCLPIPRSGLSRPCISS